MSLWAAQQFRVQNRAHFTQCQRINSRTTQELSAPDVTVRGLLASAAVPEADQTCPGVLDRSEHFSLLATLCVKQRECMQSLTRLHPAGKPSNHVTTNNCLRSCTHSNTRLHHHTEWPLSVCVHSQLGHCRCERTFESRLCVAHTMAVVAPRNSIVALPGPTSNDRLWAANCSAVLETWQQEQVHKHALNNKYNC